MLTKFIQWRVVDSSEMASKARSTEPSSSAYPENDEILLEIEENKSFEVLILFYLKEEENKKKCNT